MKPGQFRCPLSNSDLVNVCLRRTPTNGAELAFLIRQRGPCLAPFRAHECARLGREDVWRTIGTRTATARTAHQDHRRIDRASRIARAASASPAAPTACTARAVNRRAHLPARDPRSETPPARTRIRLTHRATRAASDHRAARPMVPRQTKTPRGMNRCQTARKPWKFPAATAEIIQPNERERRNLRPSFLIYPMR